MSASRSPRRRAHLAVLAIAVAALSGVAVVGTSTASGSAPHPPTFTLDHFLCYNAKVVQSTQLTHKSFPLQPGAAQLVTTVNPPPGFFAGVVSLNMHCNPAEKQLLNASGGIVADFPRTHPEAHLDCWTIRPNQGAQINPVQATNQFGKGQLKLSSPNDLCLPSFKSVNNPANLPGGGNGNSQPPDLNHYTCYPAALVAGSGRFKVPAAAMRVIDQFFPNGNIEKVGAPKLLCDETQKLLQPGQAPPPLIDTTPFNSLLCFVPSPVLSVPAPLTVFAENQFGSGALVPSTSKYFCVPTTISTPAGG
jgi:hypothetical protein